MFTFYLFTFYLFTFFLSSISGTYAKNTEIKLVVRFDRCLTHDNVVTFTCDVSSSIYVIISKVLFMTEQNDADSNDYVLQVSGVNEYLGMYYVLVLDSS